MRVKPDPKSLRVLGRGFRPIKRPNYEKIMIDSRFESVHVKSRPVDILSTITGPVITACSSLMLFPSLSTHARRTQHRPIHDLRRKRRAPITKQQNPRKRSLPPSLVAGIGLPVLWNVEEAAALQRDDHSGNSFGFPPFG